MYFQMGFHYKNDKSGVSISISKKLTQIPTTKTYLEVLKLLTWNIHEKKKKKSNQNWLWIVFIDIILFFS